MSILQLENTDTKLLGGDKGTMVSSKQLEGRQNNALN